MAFGDVLIEAAVPEKPAGATETPAEYTAKVSKACAVHFIAKGINPARFQWTGRYDVPEAPSDAPTFIESLLASTSIQTGDYTFSLTSTSGATRYCISHGYWECYTGVIGAPVSPAAPNAFSIPVSLANGLSVSVQVTFVVRWRQKFPEGGVTA